MKHFFLSLFTLTLGSSFLFSSESWPTGDAIPDGIEHLRTLDDIEEYRLQSNGLRILLYPNEGLPVASVMVTYQVGSRNEVTGTTGATHILEHMMFKGTPDNNKENGEDYSSQMERIGARSNATTYFDRTNYYAVLPSNHVPLAIRLEADRMRNLRITPEDLASEMTVVRNEYERGENNTVRTLIKEIYAAAFLAHPYGHPTIGWLSDIENTSPEKLRDFYDTYYWPENTCLSIIGGFDRESTLQSILHHYGPLENAKQALPVMDTIEPEQLGPRRLIIERAGQVGVVSIAYKVPAGTDKDWAALTLLEQLIGADKTGRLYRALEDNGKAGATFTFAPQLRDPGLFFFAAYLTPQATHEEAEAIMLEEIAKVVEQGIDEEELARAKSVIRANTIFQRDGPYKIASQINEAIAMGDWTSYINLPKAIEKVTASEVQRVAAKYFIQKNSTTGWFVPQGSMVAARLNGTPYGPNYLREPDETNPPKTQAPESSPPAEEVQAKAGFAQKMQSARIGDIHLVTIPMPIEGVVSFVGSFAAGSSRSPVEAPMLADMTAIMLEQGTVRNDRFTLAEQLESIGASMQFKTDAHALNFSGKFLRQDAGIVMSLLSEQLREPAFSPEILTAQKQRAKAGLLQAMESTDFMADAQISRMIYPEGHPNNKPTLASQIASLETITVEDLQKFHAQHYGPKSMLLVFAGDIRFEQLTAAVENAFSNWSGGQAYPENTAQPYPASAKTESITLADKPSVSVRQAYPTQLKRTDPDYLPFMVGNYLLGGSFHSRLMETIRQKQGLTYSIYTLHSGDLLSKGNWGLAASFAPALLDKGIESTQTVVEEWYEKGVTEEEVRAACATLSGSYLVRLSTTSSVANQVHSFLQRGLPADYIDRYTTLLHQVDAAQVNAAVQKYFNPSQLSTVLCGDFSNRSQTKSGTQTAGPTQKIDVRLDTPNSGWRIRILEVYRSAGKLTVVSQLEYTSNESEDTISTVSDSIQITDNQKEEPVEHYILGKEWDWGEKQGYYFFDSMEQVRSRLEAAQRIHPIL
ncbi:MAG: M16 family metallopeptidase [Coraliomargaritaceae bacterium]